MNAVYHDDGTVTLTLTRAEAHVAIWGGKEEILNAIQWNIRHALVAAEDQIPEEAYTKTVEEVERLTAELHPDPSTANA